MTATFQSSRTSLPDLVAEIQGRLQRSGVTFADMRRAGSLETDFNMPQAMPGDDDGPAQPLERLENVETIESRPIARRNETQFRWFLDGTQKTLPVWRVGIVPIIVGIAAAGVLERDDDGASLLLGDTLSEGRTWFVPRYTGSSELDRVVDELEAVGETVVDPLERCASEDMVQYLSWAGNYNRVIINAQQAANEARSKMELNAAWQWNASVRETQPDSWLVIDGRLQRQYRNAVGIVKDPAQQHLFGEEAALLYSLQHGHRTTAYWLDQRKSRREDDSQELRNQTFTMWYQRMWPAQGLDARHALIRVETGNEFWETEIIDDIAAWLMAERIPRPTKDSRWATMLYPIHLLELMLKRRIKAMTAGWPS
jgi:hypothetical protein